MQFAIDLSSGEGFVRANPTCKTNGECRDANAVDVGVRRLPGGGFEFGVEAHNPFEPEYAKSHISIRAGLRVTSDPSSAGGVHVAGIETTYPSFEFYLLCQGRDPLLLHYAEQQSPLGLVHVPFIGGEALWGGYRPYPEPGPSPAPPQ